MPVGEREDRHGFDENRNYLAEALGKFVPQVVAHRALRVSVETDGKRYGVGEPVTITATFENRLPVPIVVRTPRQRLWGWSVDGELEASDETRYTRTKPGRFGFRPRERKRIEWQWSGRFERTDERRWVRAEPDEYEITVFVALEGERRPSATTTVRIG
ncbi:hypothetical protein [Halococcus sp. IIIV-5B]|uniref:hypothetical protein n=1 Tax=Halococcus sp. IIIV-5B TaxID=2321230 RepID=UPI000E73EFDA|nr:hypothetical protein [Halococcus sp. IIIV-5B]RJT06164.1 hypothetical protein D3261_06460 [Halococcus sp. IIIV-5B]